MAKIAVPHTSNSHSKQIVKKIKVITVENKLLFNSASNNCANDDSNADEQDCSPEKLVDYFHSQPIYVLKLKSVCSKQVIGYLIYTHIKATSLSCAVITPPPEA